MTAMFFMMKRAIKVGHHRNAISNIECWLSSFEIFQGIRTSIAKGVGAGSTENFILKTFKVPEGVEHFSGGWGA